MWAKLCSALNANPATARAIADGLFEKKIIPTATQQEIAQSVYSGRQIAGTLMTAVDAYVRISDSSGEKGITALIGELRKQGLDDLSTELSRKYS